MTTIHANCEEMENLESIGIGTTNNALPYVRLKTVYQGMELVGPVFIQESYIEHRVNEYERILTGIAKKMEMVQRAQLNQTTS